MKKLLLVDGNSMLFRAYYATAYGHSMTTSQGIPTNAVYGFAMMLQKAIDTVQPDSILVAFDAGKHTFRHDIFPEYKGGRKPVPDDLVPQFAMTRDYLDGFHIRWIEMPDIEADDLIGTMSRQASAYQTSILSSDHDLLQLIDESTHVLLMKKGITDMETVSADSLKESMGIVPSQIVDLKGLMGDPSDNIPGVPGVGEKTALKLLGEYETVENVLAHDTEIKGALGRKIQENHDSALLSKRLATIKTDVELPVKAEECVFQPDYASLTRFFQSAEMNSLVKKYEPYLQSSAEQHTQETAPQSEQKAAEKTMHAETVKTCPAEMLQNVCAVVLDETSDSFLDAEVYGIALAGDCGQVYLSCEDVKKDSRLLEWLQGNTGIRIGYDIKREYHLLEKTGFKIVFQDDAMILASLADSSLTSTDRICEKYQLTTDHSYEEIYGKPGKPKLPDPALQAEYACQKARNVYLLYQKTLPVIQQWDMEKLYREIELPLSTVLYKMEREGIRTDLNILDSIAKQTEEKIKTEQEEIYREAGCEFNLNSPKQLAEILYDRMGLPSGKKRSTSADVLEKLSGIHPVIQHLLTYRKLQKIYSTYAEGLKKYICADGRIHTIYNQCATQTGRLSSSEPNLQNISVRDEQGKEIRRAFLPSEGCVLISCDYSQIELRMLAHMADETGLIEAFQSGLDIHTKTAMDIFGVRKEDVTSLMRRQAKTVNFGIVYGISDFGLAEQLGISRAEAHDFIATYYQKYPKIRTYMDSIVASCEKNGYVTTLLGRRREIPEIHDKNRMVRDFGRRAAMNAPIQGSAADLIKIAMIHIDRTMQEKKVQSKMILQVHDELIFDVPEKETEQMKQLIQSGMENAMQLKVPLKAEIAVGTDWYEAK